MQRVGFIIHGRYFSSSLVDEIESTFANCFVCFTQRDVSLLPHIESLIEDGCTTIVAVGGDGTVHNVVNAYMRSPLVSQIGSSIALAVYPAGSGNDYVRTIGAVGSVQELHAMISRNKIKFVDVMQCHSMLNGKQTETFCINVMGAGLDGVVAKYVNAMPPYIKGRLKYFLSIVRGFFVHKNVWMSIKLPNRLWEGYAMGVCFANGKYFGDGIGIAPHAVENDGVIACTILGNISLTDYLVQMRTLTRCVTLQHPEVLYTASTECTIETTTPVPIEADGEYIGTTPLSVWIAPRQIPFVIP